MPTKRRTDANPVDAYARKVVAGKIPAGKYHRLACARHLKDRAREGARGFPYRFDWASAERFLNFARKLKHYKGRQFAGQPFEPTEVQIFRLGSIFGWRHVETGYRRFTTAYNELPRKHGKTFEEAVVGIYATFFEGEPGADGYFIATKEKQAKIAFGDAKKLVKSSGLSSRLQANASNLHSAKTASKLEPLGSDSDTTDGLNPHFVGVDEFHAMKTRGLIDVMESATGARVNPLSFQITTAGSNMQTPCGDQHDYACRILDGVLEDDDSTLTFFAFIAHADVDDDPFSEKTWKKANPHWGISVNPDDMRRLAAKAQKMPSAAAEFKQKRLNLWVNASMPWLSLEGWQKAQTDWHPDDLRGEKCWGGVDLSSKIDLAAFSLVFPPTPERPKWRVLLSAFTPADTLAERAHRDRASYEVWRDQGWLIAPPGRRLDYDVILEHIKTQRTLYQIQAIGFDPWNAENLEKDLKEECHFDDQQVIEIPQTFLHMSAPSKDFEADVLSELVDGRRHPVLAMAVANAVVQKDGKDNIQPIKKRSRGRIDPLVATIIARAVHKRIGETAKPKVRRATKVWTPDGWKPAIDPTTGATSHA